MKKRHDLSFITLNALVACMLLAPASIRAETDKEMALKARELQHGDSADHSQHGALPGDKGSFRGVYYGYLPCNEEECKGIKMTLSLNATNKYLLVIQPAKFRNRESFEKGSYEWDEAKGRLTLTPNKEAPKRYLSIQGDGNLLMLADEDRQHPGNQDPYMLKRSDTAGNREMHIH